MIEVQLTLYKSGIAVMTTTHLDQSEVDSYDYLIVGGGTAVSGPSIPRDGITFRWMSLWKIKENIIQKIIHALTSPLSMAGLCYRLAPSGISSTQENTLD